MKRGKNILAEGIVAILTFVFLGASDAEGKIVGEVKKMVGDFMPHRGEADERGKVVSLPTRVYIFRGKLPSENVPKKDDHRLARVVAANAHGAYEIDLPAGTYTLFAEIDGQLFLNEIDGWGNWASVSIHPGRTIVNNLVDNRDATF